MACCMFGRTCERCVQAPSCASALVCARGATAAARAAGASASPRRARRRRKTAPPRTARSSAAATTTATKCSRACSGVLRRAAHGLDGRSTLLRRWGRGGRESCWGAALGPHMDAWEALRLAAQWWGCLEAGAAAMQGWMTWRRLRGARCSVVGTVRHLARTRELESTFSSCTARALCCCCFKDSATVCAHLIHVDLKPAQSPSGLVKVPASVASLYTDPGAASQRTHRRRPCG